MQKRTRAAGFELNDISFRSLLLALLLLAPVSGFAEDRKVPVVTSFTILADFARQIGGGRVEVRSLVGPNSDAHVYRATPGDAKAVKEAALVIVNGLGFEGFMPRLIKSSGTKAIIVTATTGVETTRTADEKQGPDPGKIDPHAWQSVEAAMLYVANIRDGLAKADPAGREIYARNAAAYRAELQTLKAEIETSFAAIPRERRIAITSHDALAYFGREFAITLEAVQGVSTEGEPSAKEVARIIRLAREHKARAVFVENMTSPRIAERITQETGAKLGGTLFSDALSDANGAAPTYIAMMRHNVKTLLAALRE